MAAGQPLATRPSSEWSVLGCAKRDDLAGDDLRWLTDQISEVPADPLRCQARRFLSPGTIFKTAYGNNHSIPSVREVVGFEPGGLCELWDKSALVGPSIEFLLNRRALALASFVTRRTTSATAPGSIPS